MVKTDRHSHQPKRWRSGQGQGRAVQCRYGRKRLGSGSCRVKTTNCMRQGGQGGVSWVQQDWMGQRKQTFNGPFRGNNNRARAWLTKFRVIA